MEKFLIDREEVFKAIQKVYLAQFNENPHSYEEGAVLDYMTELVEELRKIDPQEIIGIDFTNGGRIPQEVVERCQFKGREN